MLNQGKAIDGLNRAKTSLRHRHGLLFTTKFTRETHSSKLSTATLIFSQSAYKLALAMFQVTSSFPLLGLVIISFPFLFSSYPSFLISLPLFVHISFFPPLSPFSLFPCLCYCMFSVCLYLFLCWCKYSLRNVHKNLMICSRLHVYFLVEKIQGENCLFHLGYCDHK